MAQTKPIALRIRDVRSEHLNKNISVKGYLLDYSEVRPLIISADFNCPSCDTKLTLLQVDKIFRKPLRCACGYIKKFEETKRETVDFQKIVLSETKNRDKPHSEIFVFLKGNMSSPKNNILGKVNKLVSVTGILKEVEIESRDGISVMLDFGIDAEHIK